MSWLRKPGVPVDCGPKRRIVGLTESLRQIFGAVGGVTLQEQPQER